jgi:hypothetical protein
MNKVTYECDPTMHTDASGNQIWLCRALEKTIVNNDIYASYRYVQHRLDGPTIIWHDGKRSWRLHGMYISTYEDYQRIGELTDDQMTILKLKYGKMYS